MVIGDNIAVLTHDDAGAGGLRTLLHRIHDNRNDGRGNLLIHFGIACHILARAAQLYFCRIGGRAASGVRRAVRGAVQCRQRDVSVGRPAAAKCQRTDNNDSRHRLPRKLLFRSLWTLRAARLLAAAPLFICIAVRRRRAAAASCVGKIAAVSCAICMCIGRTGILIACARLLICAAHRCLERCRLFRCVLLGILAELVHMCILL